MPFNYQVFNSVEAVCKHVKVQLRTIMKGYGITRHKTGLSLGSISRTNLFLSLIPETFICPEMMDVRH